MAHQPVPRNVPPEVARARSVLGGLASRNAAPEKIAQARDQLAEANAVRAVDDPVALARAARIVRIALERGRLARADLDGGADVAS